MGPGTRRDAGPLQRPCRGYEGAYTRSLPAWVLRYSYPLLARTPQELGAMFHSWEDEGRRDDERTIVTLARAWYAADQRQPQGATSRAALEVLAKAVEAYERDYKPGPERQPMLDPRAYQRSLTVTYAELEQVGGRMQGQDLRTVRERIAAGICGCTMAQSVLGDGCSVCNPELAAQIAADNAQDAAADERQEGTGTDDGDA